MTELEQLKEKYESGVYELYWKFDDLSYLLIHKKHVAIADEVCKNPDVEVEYKLHHSNTLAISIDDFFASYDENLLYRLKPQEEKEDERMSTSSTNINNTTRYTGNTMANTIISITAEDGIEYKFEKPEFECELFRYYEENEKIFGTIFIDGLPEPTVWDKYGFNLTDNNRFNLTPIKKPWYEDESNFPCWIIPNNSNHAMYKAQGARKLSDGRWTYWLDCESHTASMDNFRPATKEEALSLVVKEQ